MVRKTVANFEIEYVQALDEEGNLDEEQAPDLSDDRLRELYRSMKFARRFDERAIAMQRRGEIGTYAPSMGEEAAQVGSAAALAEDDWMVPSFREQIAYLVRGTPAHALLWYAMGMEEGAAISPEERNMPPAIPVGSQALHGAGIGWGLSMLQADAAALTYFGDGATSEGDVYEALNVAGVFDANSVFFCKNNQWAISTPRAMQTNTETIAQKAIAAGIDALQFDGNDVLGTYAVTQRALASAREGRPVLLEAITYRRSMHTTADDPSKYRTSEEEDEWSERDPIDRFETYLRNGGVLGEGSIDEIEAEIEEELDAEIERARVTEAVDPAEMFEHVFADLPPFLAAQEEAFRAGGDGGGN